MHGLWVPTRGPVRRHIEIEEDALRFFSSDVDPNIGNVNISMHHFGLQAWDQTCERKISDAGDMMKRIMAYIRCLGKSPT